jgi:lysyl-tRNA synthetase class 2
LPAIDPLIEEASKHWRLERMPVLDRLVLRLALYELLHEPSTPGAVVIDEALELTRRFSTEEAVPFVNGVLDTVKRRIERGEIAAGPDPIMSQGDELILDRRRHLDALGELGVAAYPNRFARTDSITALVEAHGGKSAEALESPRIETTAGGRILAIRSFGKANFLVLSDGVNRIQAYIRQDQLPARDFQVFKLLDLGDHVGVEGHLFRTRTGELTISARSLQFLAKCHLPLPEKWHGLTDVETRYRQRYLDLIVNPDSRRVFEIRAKAVTAIRAFLDARGFVEVETPVMQPIAGGAAARPFVTHHNVLDMDLFLRIAPELYLKRLVVGGMERVYELSRNFRNEGVSTQHNPEFTMLEFYQAYADYQDLMAMTEEMLIAVARAATGRDEFEFNGHTISFKAPFRRLVLRQAAAEEAARRLGEPGDGSGPARCGEGARHRGAARHRAGASTTAGKAATAIFEALWEDQLVQPTFVHDFRPRSRRSRSSAPTTPTRSRDSSCTSAASRWPTPSAS